VVDRSSIDPHCVFCKIGNGDIPCASIVETDRAVAFLDINPVNKGHVLIIPRMHCGSLSELPESVAAHLGSLMPSLCASVKAATGAEGFNVILNSGRAAGQTVDHCHFHVIPRFSDDAVNWPWPHDVYVGDELEQMRFRIQRELRGADEQEL
jgi:histidine triad (HIT) family protein